MKTQVQDSRLAAMAGMLESLAGGYDDEASLLGDLDLANYSAESRARYFGDLGPHALHSIRESAAYAWFLAETAPDDARLPAIVEAILAAQVLDPTRASFGQFRWYAEEKDLRDANGNFFIGLPLLLLYHFHRDRLTLELVERLASALRLLLPVFAEEAKRGTLTYVNPQLGRLVMLLLLAEHFAPEQAENRRDDLRHYLDFLLQYGINECYTSAYYQVDMAILFSLLLLAEDAATAAHGRRLLDEIILPERAFFGERFPAPFRRGYNPTYRSSMRDIAALLLGHDQSPYVAAHFDPYSPLMLYPLFQRVESAALYPHGWPGDERTPRAMRGRIFDDCHAQSFLTDTFLLGSIDRYPPVTTCWQTVTAGGSGWQDGLFYLTTVDPRELSVILRLEAVAADGFERTHPYRGRYQAEAVARLYPHLSFPPEPKVRVLQHRHLALCLWKVDRVDAELQRFGFSLLFARHAGQQIIAVEDRLLVEQGPLWCGLIPLRRVDMGGSDLARAAFFPSGFTRREDDEGLHCDMIHYQGPSRRFSQNHLAGGFVMIVLEKSSCPNLENARQAVAAITVDESWRSDRINAHIDERDSIRTVAVSAGGTELRLGWNHYTEEETCRTVNGRPESSTAPLRQITYG